MLLSELERIRRHGNMCYFRVLYRLRTMTNCVFCKLRSFALKLHTVTMNMKLNKQKKCTEFTERSHAIATKIF
jgi:hypothetical protein